ncbi:hypothetical protein CCACVL1_15553 [Corchorus capsularis]|uniref:Uncharacterized protein n=1 Tax=Corchorus capsularis TaxID=210143 RepID=A0A1R3I1Q8_COCAP|nr:hypothetical protein CCACVL1_15553 [Corchorus capsularis]
MEGTSTSTQKQFGGEAGIIQFTPLRRRKIETDNTEVAPEAKGKNTENLVTVQELKVTSTQKQFGGEAGTGNTEEAPEAKRQKTENLVTQELEAISTQKQLGEGGIKKEL